MPTTKKRYSVTFSPELKEAILEAARHYQMPVAQMVIFLCVKGLDSARVAKQPDLIRIPEPLPREVPVFRSDPRGHLTPAIQKAVNDR